METNCPLSFAGAISAIYIGAIINDVKASPIELASRPRVFLSNAGKKAKKVDKRLWATQKKPSVHQPSSGLEPLSQFLVEPTWEAGASSSKVSAESNEKFRSEGPSSEMSY